MTENICYRKTYLTAVIARVDFPSPIPGLDEHLPPTLTNAVLKEFPIDQPRPGVTQEVAVSPSGEVQQQRSEFTQWRFHGRAREKTFFIDPMPKAAVFVEYNRYTSYEDLKRDFLAGLEPFFEAYQGIQGSRLGLRYINRIELNDGEDPFDWTPYLLQNMLCLFDVYDDRQAVSRAFHNLELNLGDFSLRYQFGMPNPDYPAVVRKKTFVLDLDAYSQGPQEYADIPNSLDSFHRAIQDLFERSITEKLREKMR